MGKLIDTGAVENGHTTRTTYTGTGKGKICMMQCSCGWKTSISAWDKSWSILETRSRFDQHISQWVKDNAITNKAPISTPLTRLARETWASSGMHPLSHLAPGFRLFGDSPARIWVADFGHKSWRVDDLDKRWNLDTTDVPAQMCVQSGDAIVWIGEAQGCTGTQVWPPSRVLTVDTSADGQHARIRTLRDSWMELLPLREALDLPCEIDLNRAAKSLTLLAAPRTLLQWWGVDVWCPTCGDLGRPTSYGLSTNGSSYPGIDDWGKHHQAIGSCVDFPEYSFECSRCDKLWGASMEAPPGFWPDNTLREDQQSTVKNMEDLLKRYGVDTIDYLLKAIVQNAEPDTYAFQKPDGIEIRVGTRGVGLDFPFTFDDIEEYIDELEEEYYADLEDDIDE